MRTRPSRSDERSQGRPGALASEPAITSGGSPLRVDDERPRCREARRPRRSTAPPRPHEPSEDACRGGGFAGAAAPPPGRQTTKSARAASSRSRPCKVCVGALRLVALFEIARDRRDRRSGEPVRQGDRQHRAEHEPACHERRAKAPAASAAGRASKIFGSESAATPMKRPLFARMRFVDAAPMRDLAWLCLAVRTDACRGRSRC